MIHSLVFMTHMKEQKRKKKDSHLNAIKEWFLKPKEGRVVSCFKIEDRKNIKG